VVGVVVGLVWALAAAPADRFLNTGVAAALVLVADAVVTGGLHLDGLADVADGVASRRRGDALVAVMRDSATGALGAAALVLVCLVRYSALVGLAGVPGTATLLVAVPVIGRLAMVIAVALISSRPDSSAASLGRPSPPLWISSLLLGAVVVAALDSRTAGAQLAGYGSALVFAVWWRRRVGQLTGDGIGACAVLAETAALLALAAALRSP